MKRHGFTWLQLIGMLAVMLILPAILFPIFTNRPGPAPRSDCQVQIRQIGLAIKQYLSDNSDYFPPVNSYGRYYGWADAVAPYLHDLKLFQCPSEPTEPDEGNSPTTPTYTDYFYNSRLARQPESSIQYIAATVMIDEATPGNARRHSTGGGPKWKGTASLVDNTGRPVGAAARHLDGANYAFADGHVKWLKGKDANTTPAIRASASGATILTFGID